jgi:hypothetical protein
LALGDPPQFGGQVALERLAGRRQLHLVAQEAGVDELEAPAEALHLLGGGGQADRGGPEIDDGSRPGSLLDLRDAGGVGQDDLEPPVGLRPPVTRLGVERPLVVEGPRPLLVREERLPGHRSEADLLAVVERRDRRVLAVALSPPGADEKGDCFDVRMHAVLIARGDGPPIRCRRRGPTAGPEPIRGAGPG